MNRRLTVVGAQQGAGDDRDPRGGSAVSGQVGTPDETEDLLRMEISALEDELRSQRRRIARLLKLVEGKEDQRRATYIDAARDVYEYWRARCRPTAHPMTPSGSRERAIIGRLAEGYSVEYLKTAIDGAKAAPHRSERGKPYDDIELVCRNQSKLEDFHRRAPVRAEGGMQRWLGPQVDPYQ